jgi:hypothetical protein
MPVQVYNDHDQILYVRDFDGPEYFPYWRGFFSLAMKITEVDIMAHPDIPETEFTVYWGVADIEDKDEADDDNKVILAIEMADPVNEHGAAIESLMGGLRLLLCEEEITDLVEQLGNGKRELGLVGDDPLEEMLRA